jgi:hypothetical protein
VARLYLRALVVLQKSKSLYNRQSVGFEIFLRQLWVCYFVVPTLTRGRVCNLLYNCFSTLPEQSRLGWSPAELTAIYYCHIWDSPNLEDQVSIFISPRNRFAQLYPLGPGFHSCHLLRFAGLRWRHSNRLHTSLRQLSKSKSKSHYNWQSVGQSVLVSGAHLGPTTNFSFSLRFSLDSFRFVIL